MSRLRELFGGALGEILKELEPIIVKVLESYLIDLLARATGNVSAMRRAGLLGAGAGSVIGSEPTREQAGLLYILSRFIDAGVHESVRPMLEEALMRRQNAPSDSPDSATGGGSTGAAHSE